LTDRRLMMKY